MGDLKFLPSHADKWLGGGCTGYPSLHSSLDHSKKSSYAQQGIDIHNISEAHLRSVFSGGNGYDFSNEDIETENICLGYSTSILASHPQWKQAALMQSSQHYLAVELELFSNRYEISSRSDFIYRENNELHLWELKTGFNQIKTKENSQMLVTALILYEGGYIKQGDKIFFHVYQPRGYNSEGPHRVWAFSYEKAIVEYFPKIALAIEEAKSKPKFKTGPHCRYCKAIYKCGAAQNGLYSAYEQLLGPLKEVPLDNLKEVINDVKAVQYLLKGLLNTLESQAVDALNKGHKVKGLSIIPEKGKLEWADEKKARRILSSLASQKVTRENLLTPTQIIDRKLVPASLVKKLSRRKTNTKLQDFDAKEIAESMLKND